MKSSTLQRESKHPAGTALSLCVGTAKSPTDAGTGKKNADALRRLAEDRLRHFACYR